MTTHVPNGVWAVSNDAELRAGLTRYRDAMVACGLVQTADTGQVNLLTVTKPAAVNTLIGFFIFRFNDTLQATAPIYIRVEIYSHQAVGSPNVQRWWVQVGSGTNGAGVLTGVVSDRRAMAATNSSATPTPLNPAVSYPSYFTHSEGVWMGAFQYGGVNGGQAIAAAVVRWSNTDGTPSPDGFVLYAPDDGSPTTAYPMLQSLRTLAPNKVFTAGTMFCVAPSGEVHTLMDDGNRQVFTHWYRTNKIMPSAVACSYYDSESAPIATFTARMVGTVDRTFIGMGAVFGYGGYSPAVMRVAFVWE